ncbi:MAG TPA: hypothetical protein PLU93_09850, partial [Treponemataceae bacterium]|nr:hypothetical protein [Treponemataceae bacterium]
QELAPIEGQAGGQARQRAEGADKGLPAGLSAFAKDLDVVLFLEPKADCIQIKVLKEHGKDAYATDLKLDVKTLLIAEK